MRLERGHHTHTKAGSQPRSEHTPGPSVSPLRGDGGVTDIFSSGALSRGRETRCLSPAPGPFRSFPLVLNQAPQENAS